MNIFHRYRRSPRASAGAGVVELMVALLLGAVVIAGVVQLFTANRQTFRMQDAMALTQESGTFALDFIARDVLRAGYPGYPFSTRAFDMAGVLSNQATTDADGIDYVDDAIAVIYSADLTDGITCTGDDAGGALEIRNRYWVSEDRELMCQGGVPNAGGGFDDIGTPLALVSGVESFQVLFGVDLEHDRDPAVEPDPVATCPDSPYQPTAYVGPDLLPAAFARGIAPAACKAEMNALQVVRAVRLGLLLKTENPSGALVPDTRTYTVLDQVLDKDDIPVADGRLRRLFTKTVMLRNVEEIIE